MKKKGTNVNNGRKGKPYSMRIIFQDSAQLEQIKRAAAAQDLSLSQFIRAVATTAARRVLGVSGEYGIGDALIDTPSTTENRKTA